MSYVAAYVCAMLVFVALDAVWLTVMGSRLYKPVLGDLLAAKPDVPAAVAFYLIYGLGVTILAIGPGLKDGSGARAAMNGAILGLVAYATYDLTNQATLRTWSIKLTLADIAWGMVLTALAAYAGWQGARLIAR
jgi:uncharacterized membrane protein